MNQLLPFMLNGAPVRGRAVRLEDAVDAILKKHDYPPLVSTLLAETLIVAAMLASNLKSEGILTIQIQSRGPIRLLVVDAAYGGGLRGYADFDADIATQSSLTLPQLFPEGYLAITLDPGEGGQRYQGIVPLEGASIPDCVQRYFIQSQQLDARFHVAVGSVLRPQEDVARWVAAGMYIERMPDGGAGGEAEDGWRRALALISTLRDDELLDETLGLPDLLHRLFHEDGVWVYPPLTLAAQCRCSRERIEGVLRGLPPEDLKEMEKDGAIRVHCQFCNSEYVFERV